MVFPGWNSLEAVGRLNFWFHIAALAFVGLLAISEVVAFIYSERKETLTDIAERTAAKQHDQEYRATEGRYAAEVAVANEAAKAANDELARLHEQRKPRRLSPAETAAIIEAISPFVDQSVKITSNYGDTESDDLAKDFYGVIKLARWNYRGDPSNFATVFADEIPIGIQVTLNLENVWEGRAPKETTKAYKALMATLHKLGIVKRDEPIFGSERVPSGMIEIRVGSKPEKPGSTQADRNPRRVIPYNRK